MGEIKHIRQWVRIRLCNKIEPPEVATRPPAAVRLLHHMKRGRPGVVRMAHNAVPLQLLELLIGPRQLLAVQPAEAGSDGRPRRLDMMEGIGGLERREGFGRVDHIIKLQQEVLQPNIKRYTGIHVGWT